MAKIEDFDAVVLHFDTEEHAIPLDQFINAANSARDIVANINSQIFGGQLKYQLYVGSPKEGGLIETILIAISALGGIGGTAWATLGTDIGKNYILGLTGKSPAEWAKHFGESHREMLTKKNKKSETEEPKTIEGPTLLENPETNALVSRMVAEMTIGMIRSEVSHLEKVGIVNDNFSQALLARNRIYEDLIENPAINGLGFDDGHEFTYKRTDFARNVIVIPDRMASAPELVAHPSWHEEQTDIVAYSPNWERNGRRWQGSNSKFKAIAFEIEDEAFWKHVEVKDIKPAIKDNMRVQWAYTIENGKPKNIRVLKVVSFNGKKISNPLKGNDLSKALKEYVSVEPSNGDLFSWEEDQEQKLLRVRLENP